MLVDRRIAYLFSERLHIEAHSQTLGRDRSDQVGGVKTTTRKPTDQLTLEHGGSQSLGHQPGSMQELGLYVLHICSKCADWSNVSSLKSRVGLW